MNQLVTMEQVDALSRVSKAMVQSGYFQDAKEVAQAYVKIQAGSELGLPPVASMSGIHIVKGKPTLGANLIATLIKNDPRYNYRVLELTDDVCRIQFYEDGEKCGVSEFTAEDAQKAGTQNMHKFPKNMLFARAISNGAKWFTPGIFGGVTVYTPEELGADVDEDGDIVDGVVSNGHEPAEHPEDGELEYKRKIKPVIEEWEIRDSKAAAYAEDGDFEAIEEMDKRIQDSKLTDLRASLEAQNGSGIQLGVINAALRDSGLYSGVDHAMNAIKKWPGWEDAPDSIGEINGGLKVKTVTALQIFDWAVSRKLETA